MDTMAKWSVIYFLSYYCLKLILRSIQALNAIDIDDEPDPLVISGKQWGIVQDDSDDDDDDDGGPVAGPTVEARVELAKKYCKYLSFTM